MATMKYYNSNTPPVAGSPDGTYYVKKVYNQELIEIYVVSQGEIKQIGSETSNIGIDATNFNISDGGLSPAGLANTDANAFHSGYIPLEDIEKIEYSLVGSTNWPLILFFSDNNAAAIIQGVSIFPTSSIDISKGEILRTAFPTKAKFARISAYKGEFKGYKPSSIFRFANGAIAKNFLHIEKLKNDITYRNAFDIRFGGGLGLNGEPTYNINYMRSALISLENVEEIEYSLIGIINYPAIAFYTGEDLSTYIPNSGVPFTETGYIQAGIINKTQFPTSAKYVCIMGRNDESYPEYGYRPYAFLKSKYFAADLANIRGTIAENAIITDLLKERIQGFYVQMETGELNNYATVYMTPLYDKNKFDLLRLKIGTDGINGCFLCYSNNNDDAYLYEETIYPLKGTMNFDVWVERDLPPNVKYFRFVAYNDANYGIGNGGVKNIPEYLFNRQNNILQYFVWSSMNTTAHENIVIGIKFKKKPEFSPKVLVYERGLPEFAKVEVTNVPPLNTWPADKTKYNGHILYTDINGRIIDEDITVAFQGSGTMAFPKKNFRITFSTLKKFGNFVPAKKYNMKAYYMDISKVTEIVLYKWHYILQKFSKAPLPWAGNKIIDTGARGVVDLFPCEMYVNGAFQGLYHFGLAKDGLNMQIDENNPLHAALEPPEKTRNIWNTTTAWAGISPEVVPPGILANFQIWLDFMRTSTDEEFRENVSNYINIDEWVDLFIFYQATISWDGFDNNLNLVTFDGGLTFHPFTYDLNECLGHAWTFPTVLRPLHVDVFTATWVPWGPYNNIPFVDKFTRLFKKELNERFKYLYDLGVYTFETFRLLVDEAATSIPYDVFEKEKAKWPSPYNDPISNSPRFYTQGLLEFYQKRERYLKYYFNYKF